jgi:peptide-methionine (S)-S-oxide reductase
MEETIVFGAGCFWCTEAVFAMLKGVKSVEPGYTGGPVKAGAHGASGPTYEEVSRGNTPYVEVAKIVFDLDELSFEELLQVFFSTHDATQVGGQGNDIGTQYRSAIFYTTERQREKARHYIDVLNKSAGVKRIVTTVEPLGMFYPTEDYHKKYYEAHKDAPYCTAVIAPKVEKVQNKFKNLLK